ncbi:phospholipase A and acyltransferase 4-like [Notolabrus celidotus]|uniref:phospholipase A and acyltransferase 4-like n=1 Tax=Notolabrus celidotus TaxID=1203425 RepID=UPI0014904FB5|nr:phospholipase A and acyltransferase 4-like [Notolabrus celidotus]
MREGEVTCDNIWDVVLNDKFKVNNLWDGKRQPRKPLTIVKEAMKRVGKKVEYSLATYNCEHFATELRYGKPESMQIAKTALAVGAGVLGSGSAASAGVPSGPALLLGSFPVSSSRR